MLVAIDMERSEFFQFFQPAMNAVDSDGDARVYLIENVTGSFVIEAGQGDKAYRGGYPSEATDGTPGHRSWYSPDWLIDMLDDIRRLDLLICNVAVRPGSLQVTATCRSGQKFRYDIAAHVCKTWLAAAR